MSNKLVKDNETNLSNKTTKYVKTLDGVQKVSIDELVGIMSTKAQDETKEKLIRSKIVIREYVPYGMKMFLAGNIIENSCLGPDKNLHMDSCKKYILYTYALLANWTNVDIHEEGLLREYDRLEQTGLIDIILDMIPEKEQSGFMSIMGMKENDLFTNNFSVEGLAAKAARGISPVLRNLVKYTDTLDDAKIAKLFGRIVNVIK